MDKNNRINENKILSFDGNKKQENTKEAKLIINGDEFKLSSFILSGEDIDGKRLIFNYNTTLDEMVSYEKTLEVIVHEKVKKTIL